MAQFLIEGKVVGWFQGRMEWGPRALGNRSILASPLEPEMQKTLNLKIKFRESFRPFAPVVLKEDCRNFFDGLSENPYMQYTQQVKNFKELNQLPAITHVDGSARVQTVSDSQNPKLSNLLKCFKNLTGVGVLINTSFNVRGEPIVCNPHDAIQCFLKTEIDYLVIGSFIVIKSGIKT